MMDCHANKVFTHKHVHTFPENISIILPDDLKYSGTKQYTIIVGPTYCLILKHSAGWSEMISDR